MNDWEAGERAGRRRVALARAGFAIVLLAVWEYGTGRWFDAIWFSSPSRILYFLIDWAGDDLLFQLMVTLRETAIGYSFGCAGGIIAGIVLSRLDFLYTVLDPFIVAVNGIPRIALAPMFIIWFGIGILSKIVLAAMLTFFLCFYATLAGIRGVERAHIDIARIIGATEAQIFRKVVLPAAAPWIITAMKVSVPFALIGAIVGEFMAATSGLGFKIQLFTSQFETTGAVSGILVLMGVVVGCNAGLNRLEAYLLRWRPPATFSSRGELQ